MLYPARAQAAYFLAGVSVDSSVSAFSDVSTGDDSPHPKPVTSIGAAFFLFTGWDGKLMGSSGTVALLVAED
jgi:hypothetical protein